MAYQHWTVTLVEVFDSKVPEGMTPERLSADSGVGLKSVYNYLNVGRQGGRGTQNPRGDTINKLAGALGTTEEYLRFKNAEPPVVGLKKVPLLRMNEMGTLKKGQDVREVWDGVSVVAVPSSVSSDAFGVEVTDFANDDRLRIGDTLICVACQDPTPGKFVVAVVDGLKDAILRRYKAIDPFDRSSFELTAENPHFAPVRIDKDHPGFVIGQAFKLITDI